MEKEYKILEIRHGSHGKFGEIAIVKANPVTTNQLGAKYHVSHICAQTEDFLYSPDSIELQLVISFAQIGQIWCPTEYDFKTEQVIDRATGKTKSLYCHKNLYKESFDYEDEDSDCIMTYHCREFSINRGEFKQLEDTEDWEFDDEMISTPYGDLFLESFMNVNQGGLVGVQFDVSGELDLSELDDSLDYVNIKTVAVMRQPYNVWLWVYIFDDEENNVVNFCGNDDIDGFKEYIDKLQAKFN